VGVGLWVWQARGGSVTEAGAPRRGHQAVRATELAGPRTAPLPARTACSAHRGQVALRGRDVQGALLVVVCHVGVGARAQQAAQLVHLALEDDLFWGGSHQCVQFAAGASPPKRGQRHRSGGCRGPEHQGSLASALTRRPLTGRPLTGQTPTHLAQVRRQHDGLHAKLCAVAHQHVHHLGVVALRWVGCKRWGGRSRHRFSEGLGPGAVPNKQVHRRPPSPAAARPPCSPGTRAAAGCGRRCRTLRGLRPGTAGRGRRPVWGGMWVWGGGLRVGGVRLAAR
jgi:hypothetical protein